MILMENPKGVCKKILYIFHLNVFHVRICMHECILDISTVVYIFVLVYMCVVVCICVYLCVFVCISVSICICVGTLEGSVWGCGQSDDSSKERTVELLTSRVDHFVMLISEIYQFCLAHFKVHLASWWPTVMFDLD